MKKINFKQKLSGRKLIFLLIVVAAVFLFGRVAWAGFGEWAGNIVGGIIAIFIQAIAAILVLLVNVLMDVASYSDFINAAAVTKGWVVVRDICNMFFVLILLVIAFATILGKEEYNAKKTLPKLIMAAVLINFSKMFCGLMIDVANVMMLTFINAFKEIGSGNIIDMLGVTDVMKIGTGGEGEITFGQIVGAYVFGLIYLLIATVVIASMLGMLVMRVVMIWIYVVLSPAAFFLQAIPGKGQSYAAQWWTKWTSNLIVGPVIAFFLWLSFAALQSNPNIGPLESVDSDKNGAQEVKDQLGDSSEGLVSQAGTPAALAKFAIAIGLLLGGMKIAQEVGGETGSMLGKGMGAINKGKALAIGAGVGAAKWTGRKTGQLAGRGALVGGAAMLNINSGKNPDGTTKGRKAGNFMLQWDKDLQGARKKEKVANREKYLKKIGIGEKTAEIGKDLINDAKTSKIVRTAKNVGNFAGAGSGVAAGIAALSGPVGWAALAGGAVLGGIGGWINGKRRNAKIENNNKEVTNYKAARLAADEKTISDYSTITSPTGAETKSYEEASVRKREMKELETKNKQNPLPVTKGALENMTSKKKAAEDWVNSTSNEPDLLKNSGKNNLYSPAGITEGWKRRLDELNGGGGKAPAAIDNWENEIKGFDENIPKGKAKLEEITKLISAWEKGGGVAEATTVGKLKNALSAKGFNTSDYTGKVSNNYKGIDSQKMLVNPGSGSLQYDAFAKNSAKAPMDRKASKDIMGVSFAKFNDKAAKMGLAGDFKLDEAAGVNQKVDGVKMDALSIVMSGLIDDEIKALQNVGDDISNTKIEQLTQSKERLLTGKVSGMSLVNSDVQYGNRADKYNTIQHENMHQAGAKNEEMVYASADALQESKLIGQIPNTNQRYDEEVGKIIAAMEKAQADPQTISQAVADQINKWKPSNAERVIQTEKGERDVLKEITPVSEVKIVGIEKIQESLDKLSNSLSKPIKTVGSNATKESMSINDRNFFYKTFEGLKKLIRKDDKAITDRLQPLTAMAAHEEKIRNPKLT